MGKKGAPPVVRPASITLPANLDINDDLPSDDVISALEIPASDMHAFVQCVQIAILLTQGQTISAATRTIGVNRQMFYTKRWQEIYDKARRVVLNRIMSDVVGARSMVYQAWPNLIKELMGIALSGPYDDDRIKAIELLWSMYPEVAAESERDDDKEREYNSKNHNFSPLSPIHALQVNEGGNVTININSSEADIKSSRDDADIFILPNGV